MYTVTTCYNGQIISVSADTHEKALSAVIDVLSFKGAYDG